MLKLRNLLIVAFAVCAVSAFACTCPNCGHNSSDKSVVCSEHKGHDHDGADHKSHDKVAAKEQKDCTSKVTAPKKQCLSAKADAKCSKADTKCCKDGKCSIKDCKCCKDGKCSIKDCKCCKDGKCCGKDGKCCKTKDAKCSKTEAKCAKAEAKCTQAKAKAKCCGTCKPEAKAKK